MSGDLDYEFSREVAEMLFEGLWTAGDIEIEEVQSSRAIDSEIESLAKENWAATLTEAKENGKKIWDSLIYRLEDSKTYDNTLSISVSTINYSTRVEMNKLTERIQALGRAYAPQGMFSSCLIETQDGKYVFIKKSNKYWTTKKISWVGGVFSKDEILLTNGVDLFKAVQSEINEETGVPHKYLDGIRLCFGFLTKNWNVCLLFYIKLRLTSNEVKDYYDKHSDDEASEVIFTDKNLTNIWRDMPPRDKIKFELFRKSNLL